MAEAGCPPAHAQDTAMPACSFSRPLSCPDHMGQGSEGDGYTGSRSCHPLVLVTAPWSTEEWVFHDPQLSVLSSGSQVWDNLVHVIQFLPEHTANGDGQRLEALQD